LEASEERKRKAKQLEMQRKEMARSSRGMAPPRAPNYPTYTPPVTNVPDTYESYKQEQNKTSKPLSIRGKGMQLGKKSKTTNAFEQIRGELGPEAEVTSPLGGIPQPLASPKAVPAAARASLSNDREAIHITVNEAIKAKLSREGGLDSFEVKGDLQLRISDTSLTQVKLNLDVGNTRGASLSAHPKVDKALFKNQNVIQIAGSGKGFPPNQSIGVMRWKLSPKASDIDDPPINFTVWVNDAGGNTWNITVEYEWTGGDPLKDVTVTIPYATSEPAVSSFDAVYEVSGDSIDWTIGAVDDSNPNGSFEFEAQAADDAEFFPMQVHFTKTRPFVDIDVSLSLRCKFRIFSDFPPQVSTVTLLSEGQDINFSKEVKSVADAYTIG
jgi:coatomer subunit delta